MRRSALLAVCIMLVGSCAESSPADDDGESATIAATWTVDAEPTVEIGVVDGPPAYQFTWANAARRMSDGRILVAEAGAQELRFFDAEGRHLRTVGGDGEGPGEFRMVIGAWLFAGDSVLAYDANLSRVSVFSPSGDFVRSWPLSEAPGLMPQVLAAFRSDGSTLVQPFGEGDMLGITPGVQRDSLPISVLDASGALVRTVGRFPGTERFGEGSFMGHRAFGAEARVAVGDDVFYYASTDAFRIEQRDRTGAVRRVIEQAVEPRTVTDADRQEWREQQLDGESGASPGRAAFVRAMEFPEVHPVLLDLMVDRTGNLWVHAAPTAREPARWIVFDTTGNRTTHVDLPERFDPHDIGDDWILGTVFGEAMVPRVQLLRMDKGGGG